MTKQLQEYYNDILEHYRAKQFKVLRFNKNPLPKVREPHLEAQHFMMFEYMEDWNDDRRFEIFDYIVRPNGLDIDFTKIDFEEFLKFLASIKIK